VEAHVELPDAKGLWIFGVHPQANLSVVFEVWRWWEAQSILERVTPHQTEPCLIAGDFNAIAPGDTIRTATMPVWLKWLLRLQGYRPANFAMREYLRAGLTDCFRHCHPTEAGYTLPPPHPNARLDYIFANAALKPHLRQCWVVREPVAVNAASDHYPVVADFEL
jgi:exonuclease III